MSNHTLATKVPALHVAANASEPEVDAPTSFMAPLTRIVLFTLPIILSVFYILANYQPLAPANELRPKVFVIGLSKTGTTSFGDALYQLGYKRLGWRDLHSGYLVHSYKIGNLEPLIEQTKKYDAFEDLPWPKLYREMSRLYPDAKFILSQRKSEAAWLKSVRLHVSRTEWRGYNYFYGASNVTGNEEVFLQSYRNHTEEVREFFATQPHRLLEVTIDDGDVNWDKLCSFIDCSPHYVKGMPFPKSNSANDWHDGSLAGFFILLWHNSVARTEETCSWLVSDFKGFGSSLLSMILAGVWNVFSLFEQAFVELSYLNRFISLNASLKSVFH